jgi:hypothetical protein
MISTIVFAQQPVGMVQPIVVRDFLKLPEDLQAVYVGGIIEGMAFAAYAYVPSEYPTWVSCVRAKTLGETTNDVVALIKQTPNFNEGVGSALAQTLGRRCKH